MEGCLFLVGEGGHNFRLIPVYGTGGAVTGVFGNTRDGFIRFGRSGVSFMLTHTRLEGDSCLTDVFGFLAAAAGEKVNTFFV